MRFRYSTTDPAQNEFDSLPRVPIVLRSGEFSVESVGLVDSGATVSVLPYETGVRLGMTYEVKNAVVRLSGSLGGEPAIPVISFATIGDVSPVRLVFAWTRRNDVPLVLGQTNFFMQFDVHFYRSKFEFEITRRG
jgi:hypothetical protein